MSPPDPSPQRHATWFELLFDLAFVLAIAALARDHAASFTVTGALQFALQFLIVWHLWTAHAFWASRFDADRIDQHLLGFGKIFAVLAIAYGVSGGTYAAVAFAVGSAAFKFLLALAYFRDAARAGQRDVGTAFGLFYSVQGASWAVTAFLPDAFLVVAWVILAATDFAVPLILSNHSRRAPPHHEHLPERFGLFTIILLGETFASALHGLSHNDGLNTNAIVLSLACAGYACLFWIGYFHHARSASARTAAAWEEKSIRWWVFAHLPFYLGLAGLSAGTIAMVGHAHQDPATAWMQAIAATTAMAGLTFIGLLSPQNIIRRNTAGQHFLLASGALVLAWLEPAFGLAFFALGLLGLLTLQVAMAAFAHARAEGSSMSR